MGKIKVLHFVGSALKGGVESVVFAYSKALQNEVEPTFIFFDNSTSIPEDFIKEIGGHYFVVPHIKHLGQFKKEFKKILTENQFDIIHSHINTLSVFPLKVAKKCGYQIRIAHSHSQSSKNEFLRNLIKNILRKFSKKYATHYFACGEIAGRYQFGDKAFQEGKVTLIKNAIDLSTYEFNQGYRDEIRKELNLSENDVVVGNIGRLCVTKNQLYILKMAEKLPEVKFVIVGAGELKEELENYIKEHNIKNVILYGLTNTPTRFYSAFDTFILPSLYEGVPVTGIEAQANGVFTIFSDRVPLESKISPFVEFVPIGDESLDKWVSLLKEARKHENHKEDIIKSGFSINEASKNLLDIYKHLLEK